MQIVELIQELTPAQRMGVIGLIVGGIVNGVKRWPKIPSQWVPLASLAFAAVLSSLYFYTMNLTHIGMFEFVLQAVLAGSIPIAGHKFIKKPWSALLGEDSADKWLGQADEENVDIDDKPPSGSSSVMLVLILALCVPLVGCNDMWAKASNDVLEEVAASNNDLVDTLNAIQTEARESRKVIMERIANTAPDEKTGLERLDKVDKAYDVVWAALEASEALQHTLARLIIAARAAIDLGELPNIDNVMRTFSELQATQAQLSKALAGIGQ